MKVYLIYSTSSFCGTDYTHHHGYVTSEDEAKRICNLSRDLEYTELDVLDGLEKRKLDFIF